MGFVPFAIFCNIVGKYAKYVTIYKCRRAKTQKVENYEKVSIIWKDYWCCS